MGDGPLATNDQLNNRRDYALGRLSEETIDPDPLVQFGNWLDDAVACEAIDEPLAMTLATADTSAVPSARIVLLRFFDSSGFAFYTNYDSHKGHDLKNNPRAAIVFYWPPLERQVRIVGNVSRTSPTESDEYFATRPHLSRLGAIASHQTEVVESRAVLEGRLQELLEQYPEGTAVPRPANWGGYRVLPVLIEFWQGGLSRVHDRLQYTRDGENWKLDRLSP